MNYDIASGLLFFGIALFFTALFAFWRPIHWLGMATKRSAALGLLLSITSCVAGASLLPPVPKDAANQPQKPATLTQDQTAEALNSKFAADMRSFNTNTVQIVQHCDDAVHRVATTLLRFKNGKTSSTYAYETAGWASDTCQQVWEQLGDLKLPPVPPGKKKIAFKDEIEACQLLALDRKDMMDKLKAVLNGDGRPSAMASLDEAMEDSRRQDNQCVGQSALTAIAADVLAPPSTNVIASKRASK
jgi:hypothetical protein